MMQNGNGTMTAGAGRVQVQVPTDGTVAWLRLPFEAHGVLLVNSTDQRLQLTNEKGKSYFADPGKSGGSLPDGQSWQIMLIAAATNGGQCSATFTEDDPHRSDWAGGFPETGGNAGQGSNHYASSQITLLGGPQLLVAARPSRREVRLTNLDPANGAWFFSTGKTAAAGEPLWPLSSVIVATKDAIYADVMAGTPIIAIGDTYD